VWWCTPVIPATQEAEVGESKLKDSPDKDSTRPYWKNKLKKQKGLGGVIQVVEHLPSKHKKKRCNR
jgi:hypothetical protein